jgi:hypothetical protein
MSKRFGKKGTTMSLADFGGGSEASRFSSVR